MNIVKKLISAVMVVLLVLSLAPATLTAEAASKYSVTINVTAKKYGAKSGKDSTTAIQKALNDAAKKGTAKKPALVKVPKGTYYLSRTLIISSNTVLQSDAKTTYKKVAKKGLGRLIRSKAGTKGGFSDVKNISIIGGVWDSGFHKQNDSTGGSTMFFVHVTNLTIKDAVVRNCYGSHLIELGGVKKCNISGCKLYGFKESEDKLEKEAIQLDVCHDDRMLPDGGPFDDSPCADVTITNNEVYNYSRAVGSHLAIKNIYHKNITISGNNFHDLTGSAVYGYNIVGLKVTDNKIKNVGTGVLMHNCPMADEVSLYDRLDGVKAMKVSNNDYSILIENNEIIAPESKGDGKGIVLIASLEDPIGGCTVKGNKITADVCGMYLNAIVDSKLSDNIVNRGDNASDVLKSEYMEEAFKINDCSRVVIESNTVGKAGKPYENGVAFRNGEGDQVNNCTFTGLAKCGIAVYSAVVSASGNTIDTTGNNAVTISQKGTLTLTDTKISNSAAIGVSATENSKVDIKGCDISNSAKYGISASDSSVITADSCIVTDNKSYGVCSGKSSDVTLTNSTVKTSGGTGVVVTEKSTLTATGNTIENNNGFGISVTKESTATASNNKYSGNARKETYADNTSSIK